MKNIIMYFYNLNDIVLIKNSLSNYKFEYNNIIYIFERIYDQAEVLEIYKLLNYNATMRDIYYEFVINRNNSIFTPYNNYFYVLLKTKNIENVSLSMINNFIISKRMVSYEIYKIDRTNWSYLWQKKIDYYEYQIQHIHGKYKIIDESIDYFIGMAENALCYFNSLTISSIDYGKLNISHKRINKFDFFNPLTIILDYKARDVAEFLKYLFFSGLYKKIDLFYFFKGIKFKQFDFELLYCRMLFPSQYFDYYDRIINGRDSENSLSDVLSYVDEYEKYLINIFRQINKITIIRKIDWI